jgi:hypothetical protein
VESSLERDAALAELRRPGTLAVMPSLLDNSPNTVSECIEHGIPFIATETGGIPELVAPEDRARVLCEPTSDDLAAALARALASPDGFGPARAARSAEESLAAWQEVVETVAAAPGSEKRSPAAVTVITTGDDGARRARRLAECTRSVDVQVVRAASRREGLSSASAGWIVFLDDDDEPDDGMLDALVAAQAASNADIVTAAVRPAKEIDGIELFLGDPGALGILQNRYGVIGLVRRTPELREHVVDGDRDPDWPLFARLALAGARIVSIPEVFCTHRGRPGSVADVPGEGVIVLEAFETHGAIDNLPQLAATLGAAVLRSTSQRNATPKQPALVRALVVLRAEGPSGLISRVRARVGAGPSNG